MKEEGTNKDKMSQPACCMCGLCCRLFLVNLNEKEYYSDKYLTVFDNNIHGDFSQVKSCGANLLKQQVDGSCVYLEDKKCSIHQRRPQVCQSFFCTGTEKKYEGMRDIIKVERKKM